METIPEMNLFLFGFQAGAGQGKPGVLSLSMQDSSRSARSSVTRSLGVTLPPIEEVTDRGVIALLPELT